MGSALYSPCSEQAPPQVAISRWPPVGPRTPSGGRGGHAATASMLKMTRHLCAIRCLVSPAGCGEGAKAVDESRSFQPTSRYSCLPTLSPAGGGEGAEAVGDPQRDRQVRAGGERGLAHVTTTSGHRVVIEIGQMLVSYKQVRSPTHEGSTSHRVILSETVRLELAGSRVCDKRVLVTVSNGR